MYYEYHPQTDGHSGITMRKIAPAGLELVAMIINYGLFCKCKTVRLFILNLIFYKLCSFFSQHIFKEQLILLFTD
jgi:hypothetical protein